MLMRWNRQRGLSAGLDPQRLAAVAEPVRGKLNSRGCARGRTPAGAISPGSSNATRPFAVGVISGGGSPCGARPAARRAPSWSVDHLDRERLVVGPGDGRLGDQQPQRRAPGRGDDCAWRHFVTSVALRPKGSVRFSSPQLILVASGEPGISRRRRGFRHAAISLQSARGYAI